MKKQQFLFALLLAFLFIATFDRGVVSAETDLTLAGMPISMPSNTRIEPQNNVKVEGVLDNSNRPDGPIGPYWTDQNGTFNVVNNAAQGGEWALATYNGVTSNTLEGDVEVNGSSVQYTALVLAYADINNNLFLKVQQQGVGGYFDSAACRAGNNGAQFGLGFFTLDYRFSTAHMKVELVGDSVTMTFSNIDGGQGTQTYTCNDTPYTGGNAIGIGSYTNLARMDNFATATNISSGPLTISPPSGGYVTTQGFDLALIVKAPGLTVATVSATWNGADITADLNSCVASGTLISGGETFRCPNITGGFLDTGTHTINVTIVLSNGSIVNDTVTWEVSESTEP